MENGGEPESSTAQQSAGKPDRRASKRKLLDAALTKGSVFHHFKTKEELAAAALGAAAAGA